MENTALSILTQCGLFRGLSPESLALLASCAKELRYAKGTLIFTEGDPCPGIFCVADGLVRVFKTSPSGKEHILHFAAPGMTFAEVAVLGGFPCPAHAEAVEDSTCVLLPAGDFRALIEDHHDLCIQLLTGMAHWVRHLVGLLEDLVLRDALSRVAAYLLRVHNQQPSSGESTVSGLLKKDIANHLNLTSETLSRTLRRLAELSAIDANNPRHIEILDIDVLHKISEGSVLD